MARVELDKMTKRFGSVTAVDSVSLTIADREFFALLGPSGCGKTTTLRMIAGLEAPTSGSICIGDRDVTDFPPRDRDVAMVFQDYALYPHMTLLNNIGYPLKVRGIGKGEMRERVSQVAKNLDIENLLDRRPAQLSGGQQQRAAVARAVVHHAQVFLFDEPLSNLDAKLRVEARGFLKALQHEIGVTTVYVTHDQAEAMALADRMAIMDRGKVIQEGAPLDVYHHPRTVFVAGFLGNPPMNLLPCRLDLAHNQVTLDGAAITLSHLPNWASLSKKLREGEELFFGIRPENIQLSATEIPAAFPGQIYVVQPLGSETITVVQVGDKEISVRLFTDEPPKLSGRVWLQPAPNRIYLYRANGELVE
ncbi:MAG: ABC transporter ATP-binding protein [Chloroflexi bacterium]|nr:ABC transporter ATP-binding protein [Chloroflexota bacterium]